MPGGQRRECGGFTVLELLIVVAVLAVLLALAVPMFIGSRARAADARAKADARLALEAQKAIFTGDFSYGDASTLEQEEPAIDAVDGETAVLGKVVVRLAPDRRAVRLVAASTSGKCYWVDESMTATAYASGSCEVDPAALVWSDGW